MQVQLKPWGNSTGVRFSKEFLKRAGLGPNDTLEAEIVDGRIVLTPGFRHRSLRERAADEREERLLVVSHGVALRAAIRNLLGDADAWKMPIENCVLYRCTIENGRFSPLEKLTLDDGGKEA